MPMRQKLDSLLGRVMPAESAKISNQFAEIISDCDGKYVKFCNNPIRREIMKGSTLIIVLTAMLALFSGAAYGQSSTVNLFSVSGTIGSDGPDADTFPDSIKTDTNIVFTIRYTNSTGFNMVGATNGWTVYSPDGAVWDSTKLDTLALTGAGWLARADLAFGFYPIDTPNFDDPTFEGTDSNGFVANGAAPDTVGLNLLSNTAPHFQNGFDQNAVTITVKALNDSHHGKHLCLDTRVYDVSANAWLWALTAGGSSVPIWGGPFCFKIIDPNAPVVVNLVTTPDSLGFTAIEGGSNPAPKTFDITSDAAPLIFTLTESDSWFNTDIPGGTTPSTALVSVNIAGLAPGNYRDSITVTSAAATNSPQYVIVTLSVAAAPKLLEVNPDTLYFMAQENGAPPAEQSFAVTETGGFAITYSVAETSTRLTLNKVGGTTPDSVGVDVNISGLTPGVYIDSVIVASGAAGNSPVKEYVRIEITAAPKSLSVNPDTLYFTAEQNGASPAAQKFTVAETGGYVIPYTLLDNAGWIVLNKAGGNTPDSVTVSIDLFGLNPAVYLDSIQVSSGAANNSPVFEYVQLEVTAPVFLLDVTPDSLVFSALEGGANPVDQNFGVIETGGGNISFTLNENTPWFSLNKGGGNTPDVVTVSVNISGLAPDTYYGGVTVSSGAANNSPVTEIIKLVITAIPRILQASPDSLAFQAIDNDNSVQFPAATVHITDSFNVGIAYSVTEDVSWANTSPASGSTPDSFSVIADTAGVNDLAPGFYQDTILITAATATNSPVRVFVSLEISAQPNNPPVIAPIVDYTISEGGHLVVSVMATDADEDQLYLSTSLLPPNASFFDSGNGNGYLTFDPNYNQAGDYPITIYASDLDDTTSENFLITVINEEPGTEGDTLHVGSVPAVPGQQVVVPLSLASSCELHGVEIPFAWNGVNGFIVLDSIKFNEVLVGHITNRIVDIDNDAWTGVFGFAAIAPDLPIPAGHYDLAHLYFSVNPVTSGGAYYISPGLTTTRFARDCGNGIEESIPVIPGGGGNIIVDTSNVYVCGYVVDEEGVGIHGATVELWADYPCDGPHQTTMTNGEGAYAFTGFTLGSFDLYAWKRGNDNTTWNDAYYPQDVNVNFGENGIMIELPAVQSFTPSDVWVDYFCDLNTLFNCPLPVGSIVEVWDEQNVLCGRQFVLDPGVYRFMPVYRDSSGSVEDEGASTGDNLRFYINGVQALADGNTIYPDAYDQVVVCLSGGQRLTKECLLNTGWNLTSWNLDTDTDDIEEVLSSLDGCIEVVLGFEQGGKTYVPGMDIFNTLDTVDHFSGYWIKLGEDCNHTLEISGVPVDQDTPIPVNSGWNLVSYLPNDMHAIQDALYSLNGILSIAYTYDGIPLVYIPGQDPFNTLTEMESCFGYWLKTGNGVLTYPPASGVAPKILTSIPNASLTEKSGPVEPTRNWINMYSYNLTLDGQPVSIGASVTAHNLSGNTIGHYAMKANGTFGFMPVYADAADESIAGIKKGERFYLSVDGQKTSEEFTWTEQGALIEVAALTTGAGGESNLPDAYVLEQNYPNPFNPSTTISFSLPAASQATLEIFNLLGQKVATPYDGLAEAGEHRIVWNGRTITGETASSGIYLYRLTAGQYVKTLKMTLVK